MTQPDVTRPYRQPCGAHPRPSDTPTCTLISGHVGMHKDENRSATWSQPDSIWADPSDHYRQESS